MKYQPLYNRIFIFKQNSFAYNSFVYRNVSWFCLKKSEYTYEDTSPLQSVYTFFIDVTHTKDINVFFRIENYFLCIAKRFTSKGYMSVSFQHNINLPNCVCSNICTYCKACSYETMHEVIRFHKHKKIGPQIQKFMKKMFFFSFF